MIITKQASLHQIAGGNLLPASGGLTLLAGENGAGKSRALRSIAAREAHRNPVLAISNSPFGRFRRLTDSMRTLNQGQAGNSPEKVLKEAIARAYEKDELQLRSLSRILRYCKYAPEVGFRINASPDAKKGLTRSDIEEAARGQSRDADELVSIIYLLTSERREEKIVWLDFDDFSLDHFIRVNIPRILFWERALKELGVLASIRLFLRSMGEVVALSGVSSGELSLITSMALVATTVDEDAYILVDEPENSLHPLWQKEYLGTLLAAIGYKRVTVVIATHSPLIVMGCEAIDVNTSVLVMSPMIESAGSVDIAEKGLEGVMAEVFHTFTPKNHYLSEYLVSLMDSLESGRMSKQSLDRAIGDLREMRLDRNQLTAIEMVEEVAKAIEAGNADV